LDRADIVSLLLGHGACLKTPDKQVCIIIELYFFNFCLCVCSVFGSLRVHYWQNIAPRIVVLDCLSRVDTRYPVLRNKFMLDETRPKSNPGLL
jgi:hypothetical protein